MEETSRNVAPSSVIDSQEEPSITVSLGGVVRDETVPSGHLTVQWAKVSGSGPVLFGDVSAPETTATFFEPGTYVLRLTASDGEFTVSDDVVVTVSSPSGKLLDCVVDKPANSAAGRNIKCG